MLLGALAVALTVPAELAAASPPNARSTSAPSGGSCLPTGVAGRAAPRGTGSFTLSAQGLRGHQPIDVLLNTEAGAILLARRTSSAHGKLCRQVITLPSQFVVHDSWGSSGTITVPLHDRDALEQYQLSVIGETYGDGFSLDLAVENDALDHPVQAGLLDITAVSDGTRCPALQPDAPSKARTTVPLSTNGRWIVNPSGQRVKLASVSWYGAEEADFIPGGLYCQNVDAIARQIRADGFNSVRLPWSNAMLEEDPGMCSGSTPLGRPCISPGLFGEANPSLRGHDAVAIFQAVVAALAKQGVMVILDNHTTDAEFCCAPGVFNGLWWGGQLWDDAVGAGVAHWAERQHFFESDWSKMADLFDHVPDVIGADLRNEPSGAYGYSATWDGAQIGPDCKTSADEDLDTPTNWEEAAQDTSTVVLAANPNLLIFVEGIDSATNLTPVWAGDFGQGLPLQLCLNGAPVHKLVYSAHDYQWDVNSSSYPVLSAFLDARWGKILTPGQPYTAPIWVGEFGGCDNRPFCTVADQTTCPPGVNSACTGNFFEYFTQYLDQTDVDWGYWALNGTRSNGGANVGPNRYARGNLYLRTSWTWFEPSVRGVFDYRWRNDTTTGRAGLLPRLQCIQTPTQGPGVKAPSTTTGARSAPACTTTGPPQLGAPPS